MQIRLHDNMALHEGVVVHWCNLLTLKSEQSGGVGLSPDRTSPLERHDKGLRTRLGLDQVLIRSALFLRSQCLALKTATSPSHLKKDSFNNDHI